MKEIRDIYLKNVDRISFDRFQGLKSDLIYIFIESVLYEKNVLYILLLSITIFHIRTLI